MAATFTLISATMDRERGGSSIAIQWTADASGNGGSVTTDQLLDNIGQKVTAYLEGMFFYGAVFKPGTTAPTNNYTVTLTDALGATVNTFSSLSSTIAAEVNAAGSQGYGFALAPLVPYTLTVANTSVANATGTIVLLFCTAR